MKQYATINEMVRDLMKKAVRGYIRREYTEYGLTISLAELKREIRYRNAYYRGEIMVATHPVDGLPYGSRYIDKLGYVIVKNNRCIER